MVDLADNLGPHTEQAQQVTLSCDGIVVSGRRIGAQEYFDVMRETVLEGAGELMAKYKIAAAHPLHSLSLTLSVCLSAAKNGTTFTSPTTAGNRPTTFFVGHVAFVSIPQGLD